MNITDPNLGIIFCEGISSSLDRMLLCRIRPSLSGSIIPMRGKGGLKRFIEGYLEAQADRSLRYVAFRDRDFDLLPPESSDLLQPEKDLPIYLSHRTCVENYLLDGALLDQYYRAYSADWKFGPSLGSDVFDQWIKEAALAIVAYQATRWALTDLKPEGGWIGFANTWTKKSDALPDSLEEAECLCQAAAMLEELHNKTRHITQQALLTRYRAHLDAFTQADFWDTGQYLIYFSGKDMAGMMQRTHSDRLPPLEGFFKWAVRRMDWRVHPDLVALADILSNRTGKNHETHPELAARTH